MKGYRTRIKRPGPGAPLPPCAGEGSKAPAGARLELPAWPRPTRYEDLPGEVRCLVFRAMLNASVQQDIHNACQVRPACPPAIAAWQQ